MGGRCRKNAPVAGRGVGVCVLFVLTLVCVGCATPAPKISPAAHTGEITPVEATPIAVAGEPLVMLIQSSGGPDPGGRSVPAELDDGRRLRAELHRIHAGATIDAPAWLGRARRWWEGTPAEGEPTTTPRITLDLLLVDLPENASGRSLKIAGTPTPLDWRDAPAVGADGALWAMDLLPAALESADAQAKLFASLGPAMKDPTLRWRSALLADRLSAGGYDVLANRIRGVRFTEVALEALARGIQMRWRMALERLEGADADAARALASRLTTIIATPDGRVIPAWTPASPALGLDTLLADLLNQSLTDAAVRARAQAWIAAQPDAVAWVSDDAGDADVAHAVAMARVGVADLAGRGGVAVATLPPGRAGPRLTVAPFGSVLLAAAAPIDESIGAPGDAAARVVRARMGDWSSRLGVISRALPVHPPGLRIGPLVEPWSLASWLAGSPTTPAADRAAAALIHRRTDGVWELTVECRTPTEELTPGDRVRIWFGPTGRPRAVLVVDARGFIFDELEGTQEKAPARTPIVVQRSADRWSCAVKIPDGAIEEGRVVRVAIERLDDAGGRWTWPRPVFAWEKEPGRAMVSLNDWLGLGRRRGG